MSDYEERIRQARRNMSPSFEALADYLLDSYIQAAFLTATELAHVVDVDPATVVRFAQRLGYPGYPELQQEIQDRVKNDFLIVSPAEPDSASHATELAMQELIRSLDLTRRAFPVETAEKLITALDEAERVILLSEGLAAAPARSLGAWLEAAGYTVHFSGDGPSEIARAIAGARRGDLAIAVEVVEQSAIISRALEEAKRAKLRTATLVAAPSLPSAARAEMVIAGHASPEPGIGQVVVEAMVHSLIQLLLHARPGRFSDISHRVAEIVRKLEGSGV
jgi:DNA-binding MurR/RpiR family transcriptional regulator